MDALHFEWDEVKANANLQKNGVGFDEARPVLREVKTMRTEYDFSKAVKNPYKKSQR